MTNEELISCVAEYISDDIRRGLFNTISYQLGVSMDWLYENADAICDEIMETFEYPYAYYEIFADNTLFIDKPDDLRSGCFYVITQTPSMYVATHNGSQSICVVMAFNEEDAKRKAKEELGDYNIIMKVEGDCYTESF